MFGVKKLYWKDARSDLTLINPGLAKVIDALDPGMELPLYRVSYPFGASIYRRGVLQLPMKDGRCVPIYSPQVPADLQHDLSYQSLPLTVFLNRASEKFIQTDDAVIPLDMLQPGEILGAHYTGSETKSFEEVAPWDISAGARSLFLLPSISNRQSHNRLRAEFKFSLPVPEQIADHWLIFRCIAGCEPSLNPWQSNLLIFPRTWFNHSDYTAEWQQFYRVLYGTKNSATSQDAGLSTILAWKNALAVLEARRLKPSLYLLDTVKHLAKIALNKVPGFVAADLSEVCAPVREIQQAYLDVYDLRESLPVMMHPNSLRNTAQEACYYSLGLPTLLEGFPNQFSTTSVLNQLRELRRLQYLLHDHFDHSSEKYALSLPLSGYEYFHLEEDLESEIYSSKKLAATDKRIALMAANYPQRQLPSASAFLRGCIRITRQDDQT